MPSPNAFNAFASQLSSRGLPTSQLNDVKFVAGLDQNANSFTRNAYNGGATAVTQGSTIYVQPNRFDEVANFRSPSGFEEVYHTSQFTQEGGPRFYGHYGISSIGGILSGLGSYSGNMYEAFAQGASKVMYDSAKSAMCPR